MTGFNVSTNLLEAFTATVESIGDFMIRSVLELMTMTNVRYLQAHPDTPPCTESTAWSAPRKIFADDEAAWCDVGKILEDGAASGPSLTAWRAAELIVKGALVCVRIRQARPSFAIQTGVEIVVMPKDGFPNKIRRRVQRLLARQRRGEPFAEIVPGIPTSTEWQ